MHMHVFVSIAFQFLLLVIMFDHLQSRNDSNKYNIVDTVYCYSSIAILFFFHLVIKVLLIFLYRTKS